MLSKMSAIENQIKRDVKQIERALLDLQKRNKGSKIMRRIAIAAAFVSALIALFNFMK